MRKRKRIKETSRQPEPTLTWWRGHDYTQRELAGVLVKQAEYFYAQTSGFSEFIGENPFADPRVAAALPPIIDHLIEATTLLNLLLLLDDENTQDGNNSKKRDDKDTKKDDKDEKKDDAKTKGGAQEKLVDSWKDDLKKEYDKQSDKCKEHQKFDGKGGYWEWVKTFAIVGGKGQKGWLDRVDKILEKVSDKEKQKKLRERLEKLGKKIIGEVSKDNDCRKIRTWANPLSERGKPNLKDWGDKLEKAMNSDKGDGAEIEKALDDIEKEVDAALK